MPYTIMLFPLTAKATFFIFAAFFAIVADAESDCTKICAGYVENAGCWDRASTCPTESCPYTPGLKLRFEGDF
jgi:hypothetical protein